MRPHDAPPGPLRVAVASELSLGSPRAHAINVVKTAGGFLRLGHRVVLLCRPPEDARPPGDALQWYAEPEIEARLFRPRGTAGDTSASFAEWAVAAAIDWEADLLYARSFHTAIASAPLLPTVLETHAHVGCISEPLDRCLALTRSPDARLAVSTISTVLAEHYAERGGDPARLRVVPDGVDLDLFTHDHPPPPPPPPLTRPGPHAVYCGHLYPEKGVSTILGAASRLPGVQFHLVGGMDDDIAEVSARALADGLGNVEMHGRRPHAEVPAWLRAADVLLLPPTPDHPSAAWTSPVKLGEYLASQRPIVASDIPGLRAWADAPAVRWFKGGDPASLSEGVAAALAESKPEALLRGAAQWELAERYSYPSRCESLIAAAWATIRPMERAA